MIILVIIFFLTILIINMWIYLELGLYRYIEEMFSLDLTLFVSCILNQNYFDMLFSFLYDICGNLINVSSRNVDFDNSIIQFKYYNYEY
jgi:hypothetical protein